MPPVPRSYPECARTNTITLQLEREQQAADTIPPPPALPADSGASQGRSGAASADYGQRDLHGLPPDQTERPNLIHSWQSSVPFAETPNLTYKLRRDLKTVAEVWMEWAQGFGPGQPAVCQLEDHGKGWRASPAERKFFQLRSVLYRVIPELSDIVQLPIPVVVEKLDHFIKTRKGMSLPKLQKSLHGVHGLKLLEVLDW